MDYPYEVPGNWEWVKLQDVCAIPITDGTHQTPTYSNQSEGIPFISAKDVTSGRIKWENAKYITKELHEKLYARIAPQIDDVLLAKNGTTGIAAIVETERVFDIYVTIAVLRANKMLIVPKYLFYLVNSLVCKLQFDMHLTGIGVPNLHLRDINVTKIPLAPLPEQHRIVARIESLFSKLDEAKEKAQSVLDGFENRRAAILHKAFTGELTKKWRDERGIGFDSWETENFGEIAAVKSNIVDPKDYQDFPHIAPDNIEKKTGRLLEYHTIAEDKVTSEKHKFFAGQILYSKLRPYLSKVVMIDFDGLCSSDMYPIEAGVNMNVKYLWYLMLSYDFLQQASMAMSGITLPRIGQKELSMIKMHITTHLDEQLEIVRILDKLLSKEQQAKQAAEAVIAQIDVMKKSILARAFRGELGTNDPNDEPAKI